MDTNNASIKLWEIEGESMDGENPDTLQLWLDDKGRFLFIAHCAEGAQPAMPFYIRSPGQMQHLINAAVMVITSLQHVTGEIPDGLEDDDLVVLTYFGGYQEQMRAGDVENWSLVAEYMDVESGQIKTLHTGR